MRIFIHDQRCVGEENENERMECLSLIYFQYYRVRVSDKLFFDLSVWSTDISYNFNIFECQNSYQNKKTWGWHDCFVSDLLAECCSEQPVVFKFSAMRQKIKQFGLVLSWNVSLNCCVIIFNSCEFVICNSCLELRVHFER